MSTATRFLSLLLLISGCDCGSTPLQLTSIEPSSGPSSGGTAVILRGERFRENLTVFFGEAAATEVSVLGPEAARAVTPPGTGVVEVRVAVGLEEASLPAAFTFVDGPRIASVTPSRSFVEGGTGVLVEGSAFVEGLELTIGGRVAREVSVTSPTSIMALTPPGPPGPADVRVIHPDGQEDVLEDGFLYVADRCRVAEVSPAFDESAVSVTAPIVVRWDVPIEADSANVVVRRLGDELPIAGELSVENAEATFTPTKTLRFWTSYVVEIGEARSASSGTSCLGESTVFSVVEPRQVPQPILPAPALGVVALDDSHALTTSAGLEGIQVWDLTAASPSLLSTLRLDEMPRSVSTDGAGRAYVALGFDGIAIIDVSDPASPRVIGRAGSPGFARGSQAEERDGSRYLYIADGVEGVRVLDVTDPEGVVDLGAIDPSGERRNDVLAVDLVGTDLAIANGSLGYLIANVSDPAAPTVTAQGYDSTRRIVDVAIDASNGLLFAPRGRSGMLVLDATRPTLPVVGRVAIDRDAAFESFDRVALDDGTLLVAAARSGIVTFDSQTLARGDAVPTETRVYDVAARSGRWLAADGRSLSVVRPDSLMTSAPDGSLADVLDLSVSGEHLYAAVGLVGVRAYSTVDAELPSLLSEVPTPASMLAGVAASHLVATDGRLVVGDGRLGIAVFDLSDPATPSLLGNSEESDRSRGVVVVGNEVYLCDDNAGLTVYDITDPATPMVLSREEFPPEADDQCFDIAVVGETVYLASRSGLTIIDATDPTSPSTLGRFTLRAEDRINSLSVWDDYLVVTTVDDDYEGTNGTLHRLQVFDVDDPTAPERTFISDDLGVVTASLVLREVLFIANDSNGVLVYDLENLGAPTLVGTIPMDGVVNSLTSDGRALYVGQRAGGVGVVRTGPLPTR